MSFAEPGPRPIATHEPADVVLDLRNATVRFGSATVLSGVDFSVRRGEVVGLLGQNGSGKSTLVKLLAGINKPEFDTTLEVGGEQVDFPLSPASVHHLNLAFVHQDLGLARQLTVAENLLVGATGSRRGYIPWPAENRLLSAMLRGYGVDLDPSAVVDVLPPVEQALVAIIRAAEEIKRRQATDGSQHAVIFLDEPTVFLPKEETTFLYDLARRLVGDGASTVFISHDLAAVRELCDRVVVLRDGELAGEARMADVDDDQLVQLIVGRRVRESARLGSSAARLEAAPILVAENLRTERLHGINFSVHPGEIVGIAGLAGSGADDIAPVLFGAHDAADGTVRVADTVLDARRSTPGDAIASGMALVPAERRRDAIALELTVAENALALSALSYTRAGTISWRRLNQRANELLEQFDVRPRAIDQQIGLLSGGNQQKVVLAKWLELDPKALVLHEPTQGVDVAARAQIHEQVGAATNRGMAVVWVTTDFEELALVSDRVLVLANGAVVAELVGDSITEDAINIAVYRSSVGAGLTTAATGTESTLEQRSNA